MRRASIGLLVVAILFGVAPAGHADTIQDVRDRVQKLRAAQEAAATRLNAIETQLNELEDSLAFGQHRLAATRRELTVARQALEAQLAEVYRSGGLSMFEALLDPSSDHVPDRAEFIMLLLGQRDDAVSDARAAAASYDQALHAVAAERAQVGKLLAHTVEPGRPGGPGLRRRGVADRGQVKALMPWPGHNRRYSTARPDAVTMGLTACLHP